MTTDNLSPRSMRYKILQRDLTASAEETLDQAMTATAPGRKWYGAAAVRDENAFESHQPALEKTIKGMSTPELEKLHSVADKRSSAIDKSTDRGYADGKLIESIGLEARAEATSRTNRAMDTVADLEKTANPSVLQTKIAGLNDDELLLANRVARDWEQSPSTAGERRAYEYIASAFDDRLGNVTERTGDKRDRTPIDRSALRFQDLESRDHGLDRKEYLAECTPRERKECQSQAERAFARAETPMTRDALQASHGTHWHRAEVDKKERHSRLKDIQTETADAVEHGGPRIQKADLSRIEYGGTRDVPTPDREGLQPPPTASRSLQRAEPAPAR